MMRSEADLFFLVDKVAFEVHVDLRFEVSFEQFSQDWQERYRPVTCRRVIWVTRFENWLYNGYLPCLG